MIHRLHWLLPALLILPVSSGCQCCRPASAPVSVALPAQPCPLPAGSPACPAPRLQAPVPPPPAPVMNPAFPPAGSQPPPPPSFPGSNYPPTSPQKVDYRWQPAPGSVRLAPPQPTVTESKEQNRPSQSPIENPKPPPAFPVGIPQFNMAKDKVASGLRPSLDGGLDWLQANGYRTVLHVHLPGEEDGPDRKQVEKRGMKYLSLEVSPKTLSRKIVEDFNRIIGDFTNHPLFVYDRDGSLAGGLWYLYFRTAESLEDDAARVRAGAQGFRENRDDGHRLMWLAIQKYLSGQKE